MAITGRFLADFSDFQAAVQKADVSLKGMETGANQVTKSLDKMVDSFSGRKIIQEATIMAQAFEHLASQGIALTSKELQKMGAVADEAIAKLKAGGQAIPPGIQKIADAAAKAKVELTGMGNAFSGKKVIEDANATVKAVADLGGAAKLTEKEMQQVNAQVTEAIAKYKALGQTAPTAMTDLAKATTTAAGPTSFLGQTIGDLGTQLKATALGFISAQAIIGGVTAAFNALVGFVSSSIKAFAGAEAASKKVETALRSQGNAVPELAAQYEALASTFEETTGFADDLIQEMQSLFITVGDVGPDQMEAALKAATDLAAGLGIDLRDATMLVAKAFEGNTGALKKYGIVIDEAKLQTEGMSAVLDEINNKFGGQAAARMETYAGQIDALANAWDNLQESVGKLVVSSPIVTAALNALNDAAKRGTVDVDDLAHSWSNFADSLPGLEGLRDNLRILEAWAIGANEASKAAKQAAREMKFWADAQAALDKPIAVLSNAEKQAAANKAFAASLKEVTAATAQLTAEQKKLIDQGKAKGFNTEEIAKGLEVSVKAVEAYSNSAKAATKSTEEFLRAQEKAATAGVKAWKDFHTGIQNVNDTMSKFVSQHLKDLGERGQRVLQLMTDEAVKFGLAMSQGMVAGQATITGLTDDFIKFTTTGIKPIPPEVEKIRFKFDDLSKALSQLATVAGGTFGAIASGMATLVAAGQTAKVAIENIKAAAQSKSTMEGILGMASGIAGIVSAAFAAVNAVKALWAAFDRNKGRDLVEDFAGSFGGFDQLHAKLLELGEAGEALWIKLTQGVGRNNPDQAERVIAEVEAALARQAEAQGEVTAATEEQAQATIETATQASKALDELGPRLKENEGLWRAWGQVVTDQIKSIAAAVRAIPMAAVGGGATVSEAEAAIRDRPADSPTVAGTTLVIEFDGRQVAASTVPYLPGEIQRFVAT